MAWQIMMMEETLTKPLKNKTESPHLPQQDDQQEIGKTVTGDEPLAAAPVGSQHRNYGFCVAWKRIRSAKCISKGIFSGPRLVVTWH